MLEQTVLEREEDEDLTLALRKTIVVKQGEKPLLTTNVQEAIFEDVFWQDGRLVVVRHVDGECVLATLSREALDELINRRCRFEKHVVSKKTGEIIPVPMDAPEKLAGSIHGLGHWPLLRELRQITSVPFLRPDGSVGGLTPGYDPLSKVWADVPAGLEAPPERPSDEQAREALQMLRGIVDEFPFDCGASESVYLAAILTIVARQYLSGQVPLFVIDASKSGSGKTLLARAIATIGTGSEPGLANSGSNTAEFRKTITSFLMSGQAVLVLDNQTGRLGGDTLDRLQTAGIWSDRLLSVNRVVNLKNDIVTLVTGNNCVVDGDTIRRSVVARLTPDCDHPEYRSFRRQNLLKDVQRSCQKLALAAITILRWHIVRGFQQREALPFGSFEEWSKVVRHSLLNLGMADPLATQMTLQRLNEQEMAEKRLLKAVAAWNPGWVGKAEELIAASASSEAAAQEVRSALMGVLDDELTPTKLGYKLRAMKDRRFDGLALVQKDSSRSGIIWGIDVRGDAAIPSPPDGIITASKTP